LILTYNNLAKAYFNNKQYRDSIINFEKCLNIEQNLRGINHPIIATMYYNIGNCYKEMMFFKKANEIYNKGLDFLESRQVALTYMNNNSFKEYLDFHGSYYFSIAETLENTGNIQTSLKYYMKSAESRNLDPEAGPVHKSTIESVKNVIRLAKELGKADELPDWMK
jgi:tetratricopeptide (TPR) repeat protein